MYLYIPWDQTIDSFIQLWWLRSIANHLQFWFLRAEFHKALPPPLSSSPSHSNSSAKFSHGSRRFHPHSIRLNHPLIPPSSRLLVSSLSLSLSPAPTHLHPRLTSLLLLTLLPARSNRSKGAAFSPRRRVRSNAICKDLLFFYCYVLMWETPSSPDSMWDSSAEFWAGLMPLSQGFSFSFWAISCSNWHLLTSPMHFSYPCTRPWISANSRWIMWVLFSHDRGKQIPPAAFWKQAVKRKIWLWPVNCDLVILGLYYLQWWYNHTIHCTDCSCYVKLRRSCFSISINVVNFTNIWLQVF